MKTRRKVVIERYVYKHSTQKGIVARRVKQIDGEKFDRSCYFSYSRCGGKTNAILTAIHWKRRNLFGSFYG